MTNTREFFKFVLPSLFAFALSGVYTIVDGYFLGNSLGDLGLSAINIGYPIAALLQSVGTGIGLAGAIRFTIFHSQQNEKGYKLAYCSTIVLLFLFSIILMIIILLFIDPILIFLGANEEIFSYAKDYGIMIALGAFFQMFSTGFVPFIRNLGGSFFAMISMMAGFATNILLDYLFVWVLNYGMFGAALATVIGQAITLLFAIVFLIRKKIGFKLFSFYEFKSTIKIILEVSLAPFGLTFSPNITLILMNRFLLLYGKTSDVAVYACIAYMTAITYLLLQGVGDGSQPLISQYYGKRENLNIKKVCSLAYKTGYFISLICIVILYLLRNEIGNLFGASNSSNEIIGTVMPFFLATLLCLSYIRITTSYFYATEKTIQSYILVYAEPICLFFVLITLPHFLGITGVWLAVPLAQIFTWIISIYTKRKVDKLL